MSQKKSSSKQNRTRNWNIIIYEGDSCPDNWRDIIDDLHIQWVEGPLHDKDINADGTPKKPHRHITLLADGPKTFEQVCEWVKPLNCPIPVVCNSVKGSVRYMAHLDNPEKAQYDISQVIGHGGVSVSDLLKPTASERYAIIQDMMYFVNSENITEFCDLMDYAVNNRFDDWFPLLCDSCAYVIKEYIKSKRYKLYPPAGQ